MAGKIPENIFKHPGAKSGMLKVLYVSSAVILLTGLVLLVTPLVNFGNSDTVVPSGLSFSEPTRLNIPAVGVDAPVGRVALNADQTLEVPQKGEEVGWYVFSPTPGQTGPAIMVGHLDSFLGPAVFANLAELSSGDEVQVSRSDGEILTFIVELVENYEQKEFPTEKVYANTDYPALRLITCSGKFLHLTGRYTHNLVVYARLAP